MHYYNQHQNNSLLHNNKKARSVGAINDSVTNNLFGILLMKQEMFDEIYEQSGPLAKHNEFQFHYTAITGSFIDGKERVVVSIPLVCYNYKQEVSGGHVKFHLEEVEDLSDEVADIAQDKAKEFLASPAKERLEETLGINDWSISTLQSIHRHPGGSQQGFSGTDLGTNHDNPGVIFPFHESEEESISFSSIMYIDNNDSCKLAHTEVRSCIGDAKTEDGINYSKGRSVTIVSGYDTEQSMIQKMFNIDAKSCPTTIDTDRLTVPAVLLTSLTTIIEELDFQPEIFIDKENVSTKPFTAPKTTPAAKTKGKVTKQVGNSKDALKNPNLFEEDQDPRTIGFNPNDIILDDDDITRSEEEYQEIYAMYAETDPLEIDVNDLYIGVPEMMDEFDSDILCETLRDELLDLKITGSPVTPLYQTREIALKQPKDIFRLSRFHNILAK